MASLQEPRRRRATCDPRPRPHLLHVHVCTRDRDSYREEPISRKYLITVSVFLSRFLLAIKEAEWQFISSEVIRAPSESPPNHNNTQLTCYKRRF